MALITKKGLDNLKYQLELAKEKVKESLKSVAKSLEYGDLSENAELESSRIELDLNNAEVMNLSKEIAESEIFDVTNINKDIVGFGATVVLLNENNQDLKCTYTILGQAEADMEKGTLSISSPLAKAMLGKSVGDIFSFYPPAGERVFVISSISYDYVSDF